MGARHPLALLADQLRGDGNADVGERDDRVAVGDMGWWWVYAGVRAHHLDFRARQVHDRQHVLADLRAVGEHRLGRSSSRRG